MQKILILYPLNRPSCSKKLEFLLDYLSTKSCQVEILNKYFCGTNNGKMIYKISQTNTCVHVWRSFLRCAYNEINLSTPDICHFCNVNTLVLIPIALKKGVRCVIDIPNVFVTSVLKKLFFHQKNKVDVVSHNFSLDILPMKIGEKAPNERGLALYQLGTMESYKIVNTLIDSCVETHCDLSILGDFITPVCEDIAQRCCQFAIKNCKSNVFDEKSDRISVLVLTKTSPNVFEDNMSIINDFLEENVYLICYDCGLFRNIFGNTALYDDFKSKEKLIAKLQDIKDNPHIAVGKVSNYKNRIIEFYKNI